MKVFFLIRTLFFLLYFLGFSIMALGQTSTNSQKSSFLRVLDETDLPDFLQATKMNRCTKTACSGFNINPGVMDMLPSEIFPSNLYPITISEHLKYLPKSGLHITEYYIHDGQLLENNICPNWQGWIFNEAGLFNISLMFFVDTFFVIHSNETPNCEVIIWIRPQQIPTGRATFFRCLN